MFILGKCFNEDGTEYSPPVTEEYNKFLEETCCGKSDGYMCMYCACCPYGNYFKWPEDKVNIKNEQNKIIEEYIKAHNPTKGFEGLYFTVKT